LLLERQQKSKKNNTLTNNIDKVILFCDGDAEKGLPFTAASVLFTTAMMASPLSSYAVLKLWHSRKGILKVM